MKLNKYLKKRFIFIIFITFVLCSFLIYLYGDYAREEIGFKNNTITIVAEIDSPGFFEHNEIYYGYMYDILRDYARCRNAGIDVKLVSTLDQIADSLNMGVADIGLSAISSEKNGLRKTDVTTCDRYVVISKKYTAPTTLDSLIMQMRGGSVAITNGVNSTEFYKKYSDTIYGIDFALDSLQLCRSVARKLAFGRVDYLICSKTTSALLRYIFTGFNQIYELKNESCSGFYTAKENSQFFNDFNDWYSEEYVGSEAERYNKNTYSTKKYMNEFINNGYLVPYKSASPIDYQFKQVGNKYGINWILLTSIAHFESRYNGSLSSHRGATGLMQIMPSVAKAYGFDADSLKNIPYNIDVAGYILNDNREMLSYAKDSLTNDNLSIMVACYNGGIGHIRDALRLTRFEGKDPNAWKDVESSLSKLRIDTIYRNKKIVKSGRFNARQTIHYVNSVMERYEKLKLELKSNTLALEHNSPDNNKSLKIKK